MTERSILQKRRDQAEAIKPIYEEMTRVLGEERARDILGSAIRQAAIAEARTYAARDGDTSLAGFVDLLGEWNADGALETEILHVGDDRFDFDVTRCRFAEMYREMGLGEIGHLLSCNRDGAFCEGYDPGIALERKQTIMAGAERCTFRYRYVKDG